MKGFYRNHMEEVIKFFETHHKVERHAMTCEVTSFSAFVFLCRLFKIESQRCI